MDTMIERSDLSVIRWEGNPIRMAGTQDAPLFCLLDLCHLLGISNVGNVAERLEEDEKVSIRLADGTPGNPNKLFVTEAGLYLVLLRSDKPQAKPFQKWVTGEVLPCIRKHGSYPAPAEESLEITEGMDSDQLLQVFRGLAAICERQVAVEKQQRAITALARAASDKAGEAMTAAREAGRLAEDARRVAEHNLGSFAVIGWAKRQGVELTTAQASQIGRALSGICRGLGIHVGKVADPRFGHVNVYPESVLDTNFAALVRQVKGSAGVGQSVRWSDVRAG